MSASIHRPKFVEGSIMGHVVHMTLTSLVGMMAVFVVDVFNLFYLSHLGKDEITAAVGFSGILLFVHTSVAIGLFIGASAMTARALGAKQIELAKQYAATSLYIVAGVSTLLTLLTYPILSTTLYFMGAKGETFVLAKRFTELILPSVPFLAIGMVTGALLRSIGDAKRGMWVTLGGAFFTALIDPLFIFGFQLGLDGAAYANIVVRVVMALVGLHYLIRVHQLYQVPSQSIYQQGSKIFWSVSIPAILTNVAMPVANAFVANTISHFGDQAMAGWTVAVRITPLAFAGLFCLSGAVGPIFGQNLGAKQFDRVSQTLRDSIQFCIYYTFIIWLLLAVCNGLIAHIFDVKGLGRDVLFLFCVVTTPCFAFNGILFVANAAFNNLNYPFYSTALSWCRATLGVIPFVWLGAYWFDTKGAILGYSIGIIPFGVVGMWLAFKVVEKMKTRHEQSQIGAS